METNDFCTLINVPKHLHTNNRTEDNVFSPSENIYRRFPTKLENKDCIFINPDTGEKLVSTSIFRTDNMSCVREKYSNSPNDVLFDNQTDQHYFNQGIVSLQVKEIECITFKVTETQKVYTLKIIHDPNECIYPHVVVCVYENGTPVADIKPSSVRRKVKEEYAQRCKIIKEAT